VVERGELRHQLAVGRAALHRERALRGRGQHHQRVERLGHRVQPVQPGQPGPGQHHRVQLAGGHLAQPGVHVAADRHDLDAEAEREDLRGPARRPGADDGTDRQLGQA
jgi:hypothetical protein